MFSLSRWLPPNASTYGGDIDFLFYVIYYITGVAFLLVAGCMIYFLIKYRDRGDGRRGIYSHGNNTLEIIWTAIPAIIFIILGLMSTRTWALVKINQPAAEFTVLLEAKQFNWAFTYPGPDGKFGTTDDYAAENLLRVPLNKVVHVKMTAKDVIHSFYVPQFRLKQDAVPGREITAWFQATAAGTYELPCAELCGYGHTTMVGKVRVLGPEQITGDEAKAVMKAWPKSLWPAGLSAPTPAPTPIPAASPAAVDTPAAMDTPAAGSTSPKKP